MQINWNDFFKAYSMYANNSNNYIIKDISINKGFDIFLNHIKAELREGTYDMNKCHLDIFKKYTNKLLITNMSEITQIVIEQFKIECLTNGKSNSTINKEIQLVKRVFKYLNKLELYKGPIFDYQKLKEYTPETKYISLDQLELINQEIHKLKFQNQIIILLIISTGIRRSECTRIKIKNINLQNNSIFLESETTKTGKTRYIYFNDELKPGILKLIQDNTIYLFENKKQKIKADSITCMLKRLGRKTGIKNLSSHKLRHSFGTYLIRNNVDIRQVQLLLGHTNINTTMRYLHAEEEQLKNSSLNTNPLSLLKQKKPTHNRVDSCDPLA